MKYITKVLEIIAIGILLTYTLVYELSYRVFKSILLLLYYYCLIHIGIYIVELL